MTIFPNMQLYGISNCDTVKKARSFLEKHGIPYEFNDFRRQGVNKSLLADWLQQIGWQQLLKKTGPSWRQLPDEVKTTVKDNHSALQLMLAYPNLIKRPVLTQNAKVLAAGFDEAAYTKISNS